jgi:hypothetical protein
MIHLEVIVADTIDLLDAEAYGAGALLRWEWCATVDGVPVAYAEGGTEALVAGVSLYDIWHSAGAIGTWYKTRVSDSGGTSFSAYSAPFQTAEHGLYLSLDQCRAFPGMPTVAELSDESLLILLDAAAQAIVGYAGPAGETTERHHVNGDLILLSRPALSVSAVLEDMRGAATTLAADDYELSSSGQTLYRLSDGTNPGYYWRGRVDVTYLPFDDTAERQRVQRELVMLDIAHQPGLASQSIGTWSESYSASGSSAAARADILASLGSGVGIL